MFVKSEDPLHEQNVTLDVLAALKPVLPVSTPLIIVGLSGGACVAVNIGQALAPLGIVVDAGVPGLTKPYRVPISVFWSTIDEYWACKYDRGAFFNSCWAPWEPIYTCKYSSGHAKFIIPERGNRGVLPQKSLRAAVRFAPYIG